MNRRRASGQTVSFFAFQDIITAVTGVLILIVLLLALLAEAVETVVETEVKDTTNVKLRKVSLTDLEEMRRRISLLESDINLAQQSMEFSSSRSPEQIAADLETLKAELSLAELQLNGIRLELDRKENELEGLDSAIEQNKSKQLEDLEKQITSASRELENLKSDSRVIYNFSDLGSRSAWLIEIGTKYFKVAQVGKVSPPATYEGWNRSTKLKHWVESLEKSQQHFVLLVRPKAMDDFRDLKEWLDKSRYSTGFDVINESEVIIDDAKGAGI